MLCNDGRDQATNTGRLCAPIANAIQGHHCDCFLRERMLSMAASIGSLNR